MMQALPPTKSSLSSLKTLLAPLPIEGIDLQYQIITDRPTIERFLLQQNVKHFAQAEVTPLAPSHVFDLLSFGGESEFSTRLLDNTADLNQVTTDPWA